MAFDRPKKLCFVAHRYAPYPGGTELYVQALAEEALSRDHQVWVYSDEHKGDLNGVRVTSDPAVLEDAFDLIIVHGDSARTQKYVLSRCADLPSPVLYLLVSHGSWGVVKNGLRACDLAGWSTAADLAIIRSHDIENKAVYVRHAVPIERSLGLPGFRRKHGIAEDTPMFVSCGGYWPHKRMKQLARLFERAGMDALLVTTGYRRTSFGVPKRSARVLPLMLDERQDALAAIAEADCYLMHSAHEGFGLVLLEAMLNRTPWISNAVGGAVQMAEFGKVYSSADELVDLIRGFSRDEEQVSRAEQYVRTTHSVARAVDDLEQAATGATKSQPRILAPWTALAQALNRHLPLS